MRKAVLAIGVGAVVLAALAAWRSPTAALIRLKLALDRRDLAAISDALDYRALTDAALARLVEGRPEEPADIRLVLRGESAWVPALASARTYLRMRLEHGVERLVEDPEHALDVSWEDVRRARSTLRSAGSVARFRVVRRTGEEYVIRMRRAHGQWRIVGVDRDGEPVLLAAASRAGQPAQPARNGAAAPRQADVAEAAAIEDGYLGALVEDSGWTAPPPKPRPRTGKFAPFVRRLEDGAWTVQVASTVDPLEADAEREWLVAAGEPAFITEADVRGRTWRRVLVGRYPTRAEAERTFARLVGNPETGEIAALP